MPGVTPAAVSLLLVHLKRRAGTAFANLYRHDEYEHLARVQEWLTQEAADKQWS